MTRRAVAGAMALAGLAAVLGACAEKAPVPPPEDAAATEADLAAEQLIAVLPVEPAAPPSRPGSEAGPRPPEEAGVAVTAQIYRVLAEQTTLRVVPDLTVADEVQTATVRRAGDLQERAVALGQQVGADIVLIGRVYRYQDRVGTRYGVTQPASVWFELGAVDVASGRVFWSDEFDETQQPLSSNLLNWWMFWRTGPRWMTAGEFAGIGVERMFPALSEAIEEQRQGEE